MAVINRYNSPGKRLQPAAKGNRLQRQQEDIQNIQGEGNPQNSAVSPGLGQFLKRKLKRKK